MTKENSKYPSFLIIQYALVYMGIAVYVPFISLYLDSIGYSNTTIGALDALSPLVAIFAQPVWGMAGDRAKDKNNVLKVLFIGTAVCSLLYPVWTNIYYIFGITVLFSYFQTSIIPINDTIALEYLRAIKGEFGPLRAVGTISFAIMVAIGGMILNININYMFVIIFIILTASFVVTLKFPEIKGYQSEGNKVALWELFRNRRLMTYMVFGLVIQLGFNFYTGFFPLYFKQIGGSNALYGWVMFVMAMSEVPFLLFADRIFSRMGIKSILVVSSVFTGVRWILVYFVKNPYVILPISLIHGPTFMAVVYSMVVYINNNVRKELRATGQTMNALIVMALPRIIANFFGGMLSDVVGIRQVFLYISIVNFTATLLFGALFILNSRFKSSMSKTILLSKSKNTA